MSDPTGGEQEDEQPKLIPALTEAQQSIAYRRDTGDAATEESKLFSSGDSFDDIKKRAEHARAERFLNNFETISIISLWFLAIIFSALTVTWAANLILPKCWQFLDENQEDKLQLIITGGFVAGLASSHLKKRLGS